MLNADAHRLAIFRGQVLKSILLPLFQSTLLPGDDIGLRIAHGFIGGLLEGQGEDLQNGRLWTRFNALRALNEGWNLDLRDEAWSAIAVPVRTAGAQPFNFSAPGALTEFLRASSNVRFYAKALMMTAPDAPDLTDDRGLTVEALLQDGADIVGEGTLLILQSGYIPQALKDNPTATEGSITSGAFELADRLREAVATLIEERYPEPATMRP